MDLPLDDIDDTFDAYDDLSVVRDVAEVFDPIAEGRAPTRPLKQSSLEIDFARETADGAAEFLELMAQLIRRKCKVKIVIE
jgi:hypothetical protein